jgi:AhpC/TSA family
MSAARDSRVRAPSTPCLATVAAIAIAAFSPAMGCGSQSPAAAGPESPPPDAAVKPALNPDGVPYPSGAGGHNARAGSTPGSVIQNFSFQGYPDADESKGVQTISLADYYDPCGKRIKMLHLTVAGVWCVPCGEETDALVAAKSQLASERVTVLQALGDGPTQGIPATMADLDNWIAKHKSNFTEMLDPNLGNLGTFFNAATVPWNCDIDPRTMEIIHESTGWPGDLNSDLQPGLAGLPATPSYPIPAVCGDQ